MNSHLDYCFVAEVVMTIPHSNASEERIFSAKTKSLILVKTHINRSYVRKS